MTRFEKELEQAGKRVMLDFDTKAQMREHLVAYMEYKPVRTRDTSSAERPMRSWFGFFRAHHVTGALLIAVLATSSTFGVSSAADGALPGDLLYPVKVKVNEPIKTAFLDTDVERLEWERERAELRLKEASQLAAEGRLDPKRQEEVARLFAAHAEAVAEKVHEMEKEDPMLAAEVSTEFESALDTHEAVLARLIVEQEEQADGVEGSARELVEQVRSAAIEVGKMADEAEEEVLAAVAQESQDEAASEEREITQADLPPERTVDSANMRVRAVYRAQARALEHLATAEALVSKLQDRPDLTESALTQVESARLGLAAGDRALEKDDLSAAYGAFREAGASLQKVAQLLEVADLFNVQIIDAVVVETIDPTSPVADQVPDATEAETIVPVTGAVNEGAAVFDHDAERTIAQEHVARVQSMLLGLEGYDPRLATQATDLVREALANIMRGDIRLVLGDGEGAAELFVRASSYATRAEDLLVRAAEEGSLRKLDEPTGEQGTQVDPAATTSVRATVEHGYVDGLHTYTVLLDALDCSVYSVVAEVAESYPEQVTIRLSTLEQGAECATDRTNRARVEVQASAEAQLVSVLVDDEVIEWVLDA